MKGRCMKCKAEREMENARQVTTKNGRTAMTGTCPKCGTKMFKFVSSGSKKKGGNDDKEPFDNDDFMEAYAEDCDACTGGYEGGKRRSRRSKKSKGSRKGSRKSGGKRRSHRSKKSRGSRKSKGSRR